MIILLQVVVVIMGFVLSTLLLLLPPPPLKLTTMTTPPATLYGNMTKPTKVMSIVYDGVQMVNSWQVVVMMVFLTYGPPQQINNIDLSKDTIIDMCTQTTY